MATEKPSFWQHIDGVLAINLDARPERYARLADEWAEIEVRSPELTRLPAVSGVDLPGYGKKPWFRKRSADHRWAARAGCTLSHRKVMAYAQARSWRTTLVLEDDADLTRISSGFMETLGLALFGNDSPAWDVCYLGFSKSVGPSFKLCQLDSDHGLFEVTGCYTTHAYLVRAEARDWIFDQIAPEDETWAWHARHRCIDRWYTRQLYRSKRVLAVSPSLISQTNGFSDIVQRQVDHESNFTSNVFCKVADSKTFNLLRFWFNLRQNMSDAFDIIRALFKRWRGF